MAKLLVTQDGSWYDELNTIAYYYESEFEATIKQQIKNIFLDYFGFPLKVPFTLGNKTKIPDLGLLRKDYKDWWVIEVELGNHSLSHVKEQVETFISGEYNSETVTDKIVENVRNEYRTRITAKRVLEIIQNESPKILVIVDEEKKNWIDELRKMGAIVCTFQVYKNTNGFEAYRLDGAYPLILIEESHCKYHQSISNLLEVSNPVFLFSYKEDIEINYNGKLTTWKKILDQNKIYLRFVGTINPIPENKSFVLYKDKKNKLYIKGN